MSLTQQSNKLKPSVNVPDFIKKINKLSYILPKRLSFKFANKLFTTPIKFKVPDREKFMWKSATKSRIKIDSLNKEIDVLTYGYSKRKVLLIHGWSGRSTQFFMAADKLLEKGYMVVSFDAPAHGNSEGKTTMMPEFVEVIKQINDEFGPFESAIAHSLGGMALYNAAEFLSLKSMVTIGSANTIDYLIEKFVENIEINPKVIPLFKKHYDNVLGIDCNELSSEEKAKNIKWPTLVIHDELDGDVSIENAKGIVENLEKGTLQITNGLGHTKILRDKATINYLVDFIKENQ